MQVEVINMLAKVEGGFFLTSMTACVPLARLPDRVSPPAVDKKTKQSLQEIT